jgi:hypothetical protein
MANRSTPRRKVIEMRPENQNEEWTEDYDYGIAP